MSINLHGRSVLALDDLSPDEIRYLLRAGGRFERSENGRNGAAAPVAQKYRLDLREGFHPDAIGL